MPVAPLPEPESKYDAAISFLARDELVAGELSDLLGEGLNVFFFPRKQEELAGTNGLESMREPFLTARIVVVLYREPWGNTNWTRVEQAAITDRFLKVGWDWLLFVQLDKVSNLPVWLPQTHVRFALEQYGIDQLAGAVKLRVQQSGGKIEPPNALSHARRVQREAALIADQTAFFRDRRWIEENILRQVAHAPYCRVGSGDHARAWNDVRCSPRGSTVCSARRAGEHEYRLATDHLERREQRRGDHRRRIQWLAVRSRRRDEDCIHAG